MTSAAGTNRAAADALPAAGVAVSPGDSEQETTPDQVRWLDAAEQRSWRAYLRGGRLVVETLDEALAQHGIRLTEYEILSMLSEAPGGRLRMSALADLVVQSRSRLTHTAKRLEQAGWVKRRAVREDRRGVEVSLTPQGRARLEELAKVHVASVRAALIDVMSPQEFAALGQAMQRVVDTLEPPE